MTREGRIEALSRSGGGDISFFHWRGKGKCLGNDPWILAVLRGEKGPRFGGEKRVYIHSSLLLCVRERGIPILDGGRKKKKGWNVSNPFSEEEGKRHPPSTKREKTLPPISL